MSDRSEGTGGTGPRRPLGAVVASAVNGIGELVRKHVELARIEATEAVSVRATGVGMFAAAGAFGVFALGFVAASGSSALDLVLPRWAAQLIVAGVLALIAGVLVLVGRRAVQKAPTPERTQEMLREDARWARQQIAR
jgi:Putative Actinobacterial Holin-X, holin superfamily III